MALACGQAHASIVNIDATSSTGTTVTLGAGTYNVTFAGRAKGGLYDGYSLATANGTPVNFTDELAITLGPATNFATSATYDYLVGGVQQSYTTAAGALTAYQNALATGTLGKSASYSNQNYNQLVSAITFTLAAPGQVTFTATDGWYFDNTGGVSVDVSPAAVAAVPEPGAIALLGVGLVGLVLARRRFGR